MYLDTVQYRNLKRTKIFQDKSVLPPVIYMYKYYWVTLVSFFMKNFGVQLVVFFLLRYFTGLFNTPGISRCHTTLFQLSPHLHRRRKVQNIGGPRFRILVGGKGGQIPSNDVASTSFRRRVFTRFLIIQC